MNRQRAYRKLMSRSASSRPNVIDVYENLAFHKMADHRPRSIPVVKLKIGEPLTNLKRGRSVAELNNHRSNYNHYCHYRINGRREFPPLAASPSPAPSPTPPRDSRVVFMLRGTPRRSRPRKGSAASHTSPSTNQVPQTPPQTGNQGFSGHLIVKRKDSAPGGAAQVTSQRSVEVATPTAPNSTSDGLDAYEVRGSSLFKSATSELRDDDDAAYTSRVVAPPATSARPRATTQRFQPRPGSYVMPRQPRNLFVYDNELPGVRYDHRGVSTGRKSAEPGSAQRKVRFSEERTPASVSTYIFPVDEGSLRFTQGHQPLQLTQKNLEIFDYLHSPKNNLRPLSVVSNENETGGPSRRVLDWVQERQLDMTSLLRETVSEGDIARLGLPPTPEVNELTGTHDLDDPDLEVYDLTKEEDVLPQDELIDAVLDDMSC